MQIVVIVCAVALVQTAAVQLDDDQSKLLLRHLLPLRNHSIHALVLETQACAHRQFHQRRSAPLFLGICINAKLFQQELLAKNELHYHGLSVRLFLEARRLLSHVAALHSPARRPHAKRPETTHIRT